MDELIKILDKFDIEVVELLALIRVYIKRLNARGIKRYKLDGYEEITQQEIEIEKKKIQEEVLENQKKYEKS